MLAVPLLVVMPPALASAQADGQSIEVFPDLAFEASDGTQLALDAYLPKRGRELPAIVLVHGGLWAGGDKQDLVNLAASLAARGWATFVPNYRLGVELVTRQAEDVSDTVRWVREHGREYRVDTDAISLVGASAGGHIAALAATQAGENSGAGTDTRVAAVVTWSGIFDLSLLAPRGGDPVADCGAACQALFSAGVLTGVVGCTYVDCPQRYRDESPIRHIDGTDPPMFLVSSTGDAVPPSQALRMADALQWAGVEVETAIVEGSEHGYEVGARTLDRTLDFLTDRRLSAKSSSDFPVLWVVLGAGAVLVFVASVVLVSTARHRRSAAVRSHDM